MTMQQADPSDAASFEDRSLPHGLTNWLVGLLVFYSAVVLVKSVTVALAYFRFDESTTEADLETIAPEAAVVELFESVYLPVFVLLLIWTLKAHRASRQLWPYDRRWRPGWAAGGYFVPVLCFIIPPKVLAEIYRIANSERTDGRVNSSWGEVRTPRLLVAWWIAYSFATVAGGTSATVIGTSYIVPRGDRVSTVQSAYGWAISANVVAAASAVMAAFFILRLGRRLHDLTSD